MTTTTADAAPKVKPCLARLGLILDHVHYDVRIMPEDFDRDAFRVVRLGKDDGTRYHVRAMRAGGIICSCPAGTHRPTEICRHVRGLVSVGLLDAPTAIPAPVLELEPKPLPEAAARPGTPCPELSGDYARIPGVGWRNVATIDRIIADPREAGAVLACYPHSGRIRFRGESADALIVARAEYRRRQQQPQ